jgi:GTP-binding protein Era
MNRLVGSKVSITSHKPQTTRNRILGVLTRESAQLVFIDTPGIHKPKNPLGEMMVKEARTAISDADVRVVIVSAADGLTELDREIIGHKKSQIPTLLVVNKSDAVKKTAILEIIDKSSGLYEFDDIIPLSALRGDNTDVLVEVIEKKLPDGPRFFPEDFLTDQPERVMWGELIRARALLHLQDEVPHGVAVEIFSCEKREGRELFDIEATLYCEKSSHKGIIIGRGGEMLKKIGSEARYDLEKLIGKPIHLNIWVKVKKDWRDNVSFARSLGNFNMEK